MTQNKPLQPGQAVVLAEGYPPTGRGDKYIRQAENLALSLRHNMPGYKIAIVTDRSDVAPVFDIVIPMRKFDQTGTIHKLDIYEYSPFHETLFIDSDCIATKSFHSQIEQIKQYDFSPVVSRYLQRGEADSFLDDLDKALDAVGGTAFPKFNGGLFLSQVCVRSRHF